MSEFSLQKRGERSFRIRIELPRDPGTGRRRFHLETLKGNPAEAVKDVKARAKARAVELIDKLNKGQYVEPTTVTVKKYMTQWLDHPGDRAPKTVERYQEIAEQQIYPHLGEITLQKLTPGHIQDWHGVLLKSGGMNGKPLSPRTVGHAHRLLHTALARAAAGQVVFRNVAAAIKAPKVADSEVVILQAGQITDVLGKLRDHALYPIVVVALGTGLRRGEILALRWQDVDLEGGALRVERSLEETKAGLRFKSPKTKHGRRTVPLPPSVVETLRAHRRAQAELRLALGRGRHPDDALVFCEPDGASLSPDCLSRNWARIVKVRKLPKVKFHALRHTHVSALIAAGLDVVSVSRRIGHGSPALTLRVYSHLFAARDAKTRDAAAIAVIENALSG